MWSCTSSLRVNTRGLPGDRHKTISGSGMTVPGDGDDRHRLVHPPQCSDDFQPVLFGQQHVQDKHVHGLLGSIDSLPAIAGLDSLVSLTIEQLAEHVTCQGIVVNDQPTCPGSSLLHCTPHHPLLDY